MKKLFSTLSIALLTTCAAEPVAAQNTLPSNCFTTEFVEKDLSENFKETVLFLGTVQKDGVVVVAAVWGNLETQTWTITYSYANGITCVVGDGGGLELQIPPPGAPV